MRGREHPRLFTRLQFGKLDQDASSRAGVEERNLLPLGADAGRFVDKPDTCLSTAIESGVQVGDGEADVMDAGPATRHEGSDW